MICSGHNKHHIMTMEGLKLQCSQMKKTDEKRKRFIIHNTRHTPVSAVSRFDLVTPLKYVHTGACAEQCLDCYNTVKVSEVWSC